MSINFNDHNITTSGTLTAASGHFTSLVINDSDFDSNIDNRVTSLLVGGSGIDISYNEQESFLTVSYTGAIVSNYGDNRLLTSDGTSTGINAESNVVVDSSGNVGIGTSSPSNPLHIANAIPTIRLEDTDTNAYSLLTTDNTGSLRLRADVGNTQASSSISFEVDTTARVTIDSTGNVGIGTASPTHRLEVVKSSPSSLGAIARFYHGPSSDRSFEIGVHETTPFPVYIQARNTETTTNTISIQPYGGSVGIGTNNPSNKLDVRGGEIYKTTTDFVFGTTGSLLSIYNGASTGNTYSAIGALSSGGSAWNNLVLQMGGNVGIGTTTPDSKFTVYQSTGTSQIRFGASSNYYWDISRDNDVTGSLLISNYNATGSRTTRLTIAAGGDATFSSYVTASNALRLGEIYGDMGLYVGSTYDMRFDLGWDGNWHFSRGSTVRFNIEHTGSTWIKSTRAWNDTIPTLSIGNDGDGRLQVRHIWGKSFNSAAAENLLLQYGNTSQHVQIGASGGGNNLYVAGDIYANGYFGGAMLLYGASGLRRGVYQITDWNQATFPDVAFLSSENATTNAPTTDFTYGVQTSFHRNGPNYRTQFVTSLYGNNAYWFRQLRDSAGWSSWVQMLHSGNYNSYALPLSGGTLTGPVEISTGAISNNYNEGLRLTTANNGWAGITFGSTGLAGAPTNGWFVARNPSNQFIISPADSNNTTGLTLNSGGNALWRNNILLHAGNYSSYALPLSGGTISGNITVTGNATINSVNFTNEVLYGNNGMGVLNTASDMNTLNRKSGFYLYPTPANGPFGTWTTWLQLTGHYIGDNYGWQLAKNYWGDDWRIRGLTNNSWGSWLALLHSGNYNSYSPTLTGGNASGTWAINVTGTAGSISGFGNPTTAVTANTIMYRDGNADTSIRYLYSQYLYMSHDVATRGGDTIFYSSTTDNFIRKNNATGMRQALDVPTRAGGSAYGTWSINITGSAGGLNSGNYISRSGSSGNANTDFSNTPAGTVRHNGDDANLVNSPGNVWWFYDNYRHSNGTNLWGTQIAWGWEDNANRLAQRNVSAGNWSDWVYYVREKYNGSVKAWCRFVGTNSNTFATERSYNVANITRTGTGAYTVNLSITIGNADYVATASATTASARVDAYNNTQVFVSTLTAGGGAINANLVSVIVA